MPPITVDLPNIDLSVVIPLIALVILGALILATLTARTLLHSKALAIVAVAAILIGGSSSIVGGLQAIAVLIAVTGLAAIGLIIVLNRAPDVIDLLHLVVKRRDPPTVTVIQRQPGALPAAAPHLPLAAPRHYTPRPTAAPADIKDWGF